MIRLASVALASVLGVAGLAASVPAAAGPSVAVEIPVPGFVGGPYVYAHGPYVRPYGVPLVGYGFPGYGRGYYPHGGFGWDHYHRWGRR